MVGHFEQSVILLCVRWYPSYDLSLRDLKEMVAGRSIRVDHATIHPWVVDMLGFKSLKSAAATLSGIELIHMLRKRQLQDAHTSSLSIAEQFETLVAIS
ncbi:IS6 family transposase [Rhizobium sp. P32RR-XVIII]|nr:IS6 family transposase [Rhizobium sp. P32RR-XVIII]NLS06214.1 IS6 family transposase [Rhizobium sp. P32RR-XVIII]